MTTAGTLLRRRIILLEFLFGLVGVGLNCLPLAAHAISLSPAGRLATELDGIDIRGELRY